MFKKKIIISVMSVVLLATVIYWVKYLIDFKYYHDVMETVIVQPVDFSKLEEGEYKGNFDAKIISATVSVKVMDGTVIDIELLKHKFERGEPAEAILDAVLEAQSIEVDTITGATNSSKTILKAIEDALKKAPIVAD